MDLLGTKYNAIVVASDFGGILTQAELDILNARSSDIITFLNASGGLYAMAESNSRGQLTPNGGHFGFLPFVVSSTQFNQSEVGTTVTPFGASLGLTNADVSSAFSHNIFTATSGLTVVDRDYRGGSSRCQAAELRTRRDCLLALSWHAGATSRASRQHPHPVNCGLPA